MGGKRITPPSPNYPGNPTLGNTTPGSPTFHMRMKLDKLVQPSGAYVGSIDTYRRVDLFGEDEVHITIVEKDGTKVVYVDKIPGAPSDFLVAQLALLYG